MMLVIAYQVLIFVILCKYSVTPNLEIKLKLYRFFILDDNTLRCKDLFEKMVNQYESNMNH